MICDERFSPVAVKHIVWKLLPHLAVTTQRFLPCLYLMGYCKRKTLMEQITRIILCFVFSVINVLRSWTTCWGVVDKLETKQNSCAFVKIPRYCSVSVKTFSSIKAVLKSTKLSKDCFQQMKKKKKKNVVKP